MPAKNNEKKNWMSDKKVPARPIAKTVSADSGQTLQTLRNLWPYMWPSDQPHLKRRVLWAMVFLILSKIVLILMPYFFKFAIDAFSVPASGEKTAATDYLPYLLASPFLLVGAYNIARLIQAGLNQLRDALFASVGQHAVRNLAYKTFVHMHRLSLQFHLERRTGGLSRIIERGTKGIEAIVRFSILNTAPTVLEFALTALVLWISCDWRYMLIASLTVGFYTWFTIKASDWRIEIRRQMNESDTEANIRAIDSLLNFETVKYFGNEAMEARRFDASMQRYERAAVKTWVSLGWLNFGQAVIFGLGMMAMMGLSAYEVMSGIRSVGDFVFVNALLIQISIPLNFVGFIYREVRQGLTDIEQMFALLDVSEDIQDREDAQPLQVNGAAIHFDNVHFSYDALRPILKGISFRVEPGQTVAIVGPSGAGKSTISRLIFRFYDIDGGRLEIDGQDVRDVTQESLRQVIGMVPQDTVLFNDTIGYNIRYGRPDATMEDIEAAAQLAQLSDFIEKLPDGYQTMVGERGLKLSGGEKQRIAIARTILKAPPILLLDEATSALDTATEQDIQNALEQVSRGRTTLVIAHRLSTVIKADTILVLKAGRIVERGNHETLLAKNGLYASMWQRQREATEVEEKLRQIRENDELGVVERGRPAL